MGVWLYEDLREDPQGVSSSVFRFLGVDDSFVPDTSARRDTARAPKNAVSRAIVKDMNGNFPVAKKIISSSSVRVKSQWHFKVRQLVNSRILAGEPPPLDPTRRAELLEGYRADTLRLQGPIGRYLSLWPESDKAGSRGRD